MAHTFQIKKLIHYVVVSLFYARKTSKKYLFSGVKLHFDARNNKIHSFSGFCGQQKYSVLLL